MTTLPTPMMDEVVGWVTTHLGDLACDQPEASSTFTGGQTAADAALDAFDVTGYAARRNEVWPPSRRGASRLSPHIRHGLLPLSRVWDRVADGQARDAAKFRDELLWQEYARHVYARLGAALGQPLRAEAPQDPDPVEDPWDPRMRCMEAVTDELTGEGWLVNQTRMWAASQWSVRHGADWREGEARMFSHLLDGSRAANRLGWQWTIGTGTGKRYGFSRWQVRKRAPALCRECALADACPIEDWPRDGQEAPRLDEVDPRLRRDDDVAATAGPLLPAQASTPEAVWLTAESLGDADPALAAHPELPAVFVFDEPLLASLHLSGKRLVFLAQALADLAERRPVQLHRGDVVKVLRGHSLATTFAPVPGWQRRAGNLTLTALHPWPWLRRPHAGSIQSFTAWRKGVTSGSAVG